ncbi:MAG TPA: hypothetical protein VEG39_00575 [Clostridia bacterium]|nr:hypothetical protein [Clostridia bacterium]
MLEPKHIQAEMDGLFQWIAAERDQFHPLELAAQLRKRFVYTSV